MKSKILFMVVIAGVCALATYLYFNLNAMIVRQTEKIATEALGVDVHIGGIDISLSDKRVVVSNIRVSNPKGYKGSNILETDTVSIALNTASAELIDFKDIQVVGSKVYLEANENGMNILDLKKMANKKKDTPSGKAVQVVIKKMVFGAATVKSRISFLDRDIASFQIPAITFSDLGRGGGISADKAIAEVVTKILSAVEKQARQKGILSGVSVPAIDDVKKTLDGAVNGLKSLF